jgi:hypothetical protein
MLSVYFSVNFQASLCPSTNAKLHGKYERNTYILHIYFEQMRIPQCTNLCVTLCFVAVEPLGYLEIPQLNFKYMAAVSKPGCHHRHRGGI